MANCTQINGLVSFARDAGPLSFGGAQKLPKCRTFTPGNRGEGERGDRGHGD